MASASCLSLLLLAVLASSASAQLSSTFYDTSCPNALSTIKSVVNAAVAQEARMGASLLRLHFHDCFVQGCDASVLLADTATFTGEQGAGPNAGSLRGFSVIDNIKTQVEAVCPQTVSCADILAVAARDSVVALGGPSWTVLLGRRDSTTASLSQANTDLPAPTSSLSQLLTAFNNKNLNPTDMVALSGPSRIRPFFFCFDRETSYISIYRLLEKVRTRLGRHSARTSGTTSPRATSTPPSPRRSGPTAQRQAATPTWRLSTPRRPTPSTTPTTTTSCPRRGSCTPTRSSSTTAAPTTPS
ncbi:unnamed protein product [Urochloa decumbens]|uniref:Peroxidase n=1 Tax=Urochloa decumbens TaxID=240449 RepID=A0ABC9F9J8_9POAL